MDRDNAVRSTCPPPSPCAPSIMIIVFLFSAPARQTQALLSLHAHDLP
jgi:hypothetical protein